MLKKSIIPAPHPETFRGPIRHPDLWLWDSWTLNHSGRILLYCLALPRVDQTGAPIFPKDRNDFEFHVRLFSSADSGASWTDRGAVLSPSNLLDGADAANIWSGSILGFKGRALTAYTGVRDVSRDRPYLQTLCLGYGRPGERIEHFPTSALSDPLRDYDEIRSAGYFLGPKDQLGLSSGESGGPIMAWRDPFLLRDQDGKLLLFWSAKIGPKSPAIASAHLLQSDNGFTLGPLREPIILEDDGRMTQAEVPKIYWHPIDRTYYLIIAACDRIREDQPDRDVSKEIRLYHSSKLSGPWSRSGTSRGLLEAHGELYGASLLSIDPDFGTATFIAPYTEKAEPYRQLSFAEVQTAELFPKSLVK